MKRICSEWRIYNINWGIWNPGQLTVATELRMLEQKYKGQILLTDKYYSKSTTGFKKIVSRFVLTFHPALYIIFDILKSAHRIIENSRALKAILPKPPKTLREKLVRSKLRPDYNCGTRLWPKEL